MYERDSRGRIRVTRNGVRVEVNKDNVVRVYRRYNPMHGSERRTNTLSSTDLMSLYDATREVMYQMHRQHVASIGA